MSLATRWLSPRLLGRLKSALRMGNHCAGVFPDWEAATKSAGGYDSAAILERVRQATSKVKSGEAVYERDSVLFDEVQYSFPVLAGLLRAAAENGGRLSVLDFGGSLGSSYYQCREFLGVLQSFVWGVVEQEGFVTCGRREFTSEQLRFHYSIDECVKSISPNVALLSSVLQYVSDPHAILAQIADAGLQYIIVDRTVFSETDCDTISVQHVPARIYSGSYPIRIFGRDTLFRGLAGRYRLMAKFDTIWDGSHTEFCGGMEFNSRGMIFRKEPGA